MSNPKMILNPKNVSLACLNESGLSLQTFQYKQEWKWNGCEAARLHPSPSISIEIAGKPNSNVAFCHFK